MAQKVSIRFSSPGLQPPVYITTSLSEPQWEILEMGVSQDKNGEFEFTKVFDAQPGEYQYKFRLGPGDWWVCDEDKDIVDDGLGNRNNRIAVSEPSLSLPPPQEQDPLRKTNSPPHLSDERLEELRRHRDLELAEDEKHRAPLLPHESSFGNVKLQLPSEHVPVLPTKPRQDTIALPDNNDPVDDYQPNEFSPSPLFRHETGYAVTTDQYDHTPGVDEDEDHDDIIQQFPSLAPSHKEQVPLFQHESKNTAKLGPHRSQSTWSSQPVVPEEADPNDRTLEQFPTSPEEIVGKIRRLSNLLPEDHTTDESLASSTISSPSPMLRTTSQSPSLPSVLEDDGEQQLDADHKHSVRPAALITPPRTPDGEPSKPFGSSHHHPKVAELDMDGEAKYSVHLSHLAKHDSPSDAPADEEHETHVPVSEPNVTQSDELAEEDKAPNGSYWESFLGLALLVGIGIFAAWVAGKVHGMGFTAKDGGATIVD